MMKTYFKYNPDDFTISEENYRAALFLGPTSVCYGDAAAGTSHYRFLHVRPEFHVAELGVLPATHAHFVDYNSVNIERYYDPARFSRRPCNNGSFYAMPDVHPGFYTHGEVEQLQRYVNADLERRRQIAQAEERYRTSLRGRFDRSVERLKLSWSVLRGKLDPYEEED